MSDNRTKSSAIRVTDQEFEMYKKIAVSLHNQTYFIYIISKAFYILQIAHL